MVNASGYAQEHNSSALQHHEGRLWYRWARRMPGPIKRCLLSCYWPMKSLAEDWQDYSAALVGHILCHTIRLAWYRLACELR